jgi:hypothetical protein
MSTKINSLELYQALRQYSGSIGRLASKTGYSSLYVGLVLQGKRNNISIIEKGIGLLEELRQEQKQADQYSARIQELLNQAVGV